MCSEIHSYNAHTLTGRNDDVINCCCISGNTLYLGITELGNHAMITCSINRDGSLQLLSTLSLPWIKGIYEFLSGRLLLDLGIQVLLWDLRRRRIHLSFKKGDSTSIKTFKRWIFVWKWGERRVEIFSGRGRMLAFFEVKSSPCGMFFNSQHIFASELDGKIRVYSNDGCFSLLKTLKGQALYLDDRYLYCTEFYKRHSRMRVVSLSSLRTTSYVVLNDRSFIYEVAHLGSNKILISTEVRLYLFEFKVQNRFGKQMEQLWKSGERDSEPVYDGLFVLDTNDPIRYICLDVQRERIITIRVSD